MDEDKEQLPIYMNFALPAILINRRFAILC
jgi:hypothetical protein